VAGERTDYFDKIKQTIDKGLGDNVSDVQEPENPEETETDEPEDAEVDHGPDSFNPVAEEESGEDVDPKDTE